MKNTPASEGDVVSFKVYFGVADDTPLLTSINQLNINIMANIIKLHTRHGNDEVYVNADTINAFKTVGFDKPFTVVTTNFFQIEVTETSEEIMQLINP